MLATALVAAGGLLLLAQATSAQPPTDGDAVLDAEIAAVQHDVVGAKSAEQREDAEAKLRVLLNETADRTAARAKPPATNVEDAKKRAELEASIKKTGAGMAGYSPVLRRTGTGQLSSNVYWQSAPFADGTRLAVWAGGSGSGNTTPGAVLVRRFLNDGNGTIVKDQILELAGHGSLSLADEESGVLALRAADGATVFFDTSTLSFR